MSRPPCAPARIAPARSLADRARPLVVGFGLAVTVALAASAAPGFADEAHPCEAGAVLATGRPDPAIIAREASSGVRAFWCETYDAQGNALRAGPYWDVHADGSPRVRGRYVASRLEGLVEIFDEDGTLWLRGTLADGEWSGPLEIFDGEGGRWFAARFEAGRLEAEGQASAPGAGASASTSRDDAGAPTTRVGRPEPTAAENAEREGLPMARIEARGPAAAASLSAPASPKAAAELPAHADSNPSN